jgi:chromosomal replication initiation ATPase DnaA
LSSLFKTLDILSKERGPALDLARAVSYYLTARLSKLPPQDLAGLFGRDRVTVKSGIERIATLVAKDKDLAARVAKLAAGLGAKSARAAAS